MPAGEPERLPAHQPVVDRQTLVEEFDADLASLVPFEGQPSRVERAEPHGQLQAPTGQVVQGGRAAGQVPRPDAGQRRQQRAEAYPLGPHRGGGEGDPGVRPPHRLPREDGVPPCGLGRDGELGELAGGGLADDDAVPAAAHVGHRGTRVRQSPSGICGPDRPVHKVVRLFDEGPTISA
ncbi:hypothetical protein GCM10011594_33710 [Nakamurella endophytica]|uniref:Uncharacterized protein n=1 Tax=Nakamurella endophytica TaxID=1748367 RepID=A0A917WKK4_9ACTN|nr:hypothetical protein GCM10011594_33710 [Nakamurella endophytica]